MDTINRERTLKELFIDVSKLKPNSCKLVYRRCEICNGETLKPFVLAKRQSKCGPCSNRINATLNTEIRGQKIKENFKKNGHPRLGIKHTEESKLKMRKNRKTPFLSQESRAKISAASKATWLGRKHSPETIEKMRISARLTAKRGKDSNFYGKNYYAKCREYKRLDGKIIKLKSSWEVKVACYLDSNGIDWEYEKQPFPVTYSYEGEVKNGTYIPDFFLKNEIWEVKGYWRKDAKEKFEEFKKQYPHVNIKIIGKEELKQLGIKL